jgi:hypothetical protein
MDAGETIAAADRELADCAHRYVEWMIPMPDRVVGELRETGWIANPLRGRVGAFDEMSCPRPAHRAR